MNIDGEIRPGWRFYGGITLFVLGLLSPLFIPLVTATTLPTGWKTALSGLLMLGIPELLWVAAAAIMGKAGFNYIKGKFWGFFKRMAPPDEVSVGRYRVGLAMKTELAKRFGRWIEETFLNRMPPYVILRNLAGRISGRDVPNQLQPALISSDPGTETLGFIVEEHTDGKFTIFLPLSPTPGVGTLQIVSPEKVERLVAPMKDALGAILNWGAGTEALLRETRSTTK